MTFTVTFSQQRSQFVGLSGGQLGSVDLQGFFRNTSVQSKTFRGDRRRRRGISSGFTGCSGDSTTSTGRVYQKPLTLGGGVGWCQETRRKERDSNMTPAHRRLSHRNSLLQANSDFSTKTSIAFPRCCNTLSQHLTAL